MIEVGDKVWVMREPPDWYSSNSAKAFPLEVWVRGIAEHVVVEPWGTTYTVRMAAGEFGKRHLWAGSPPQIRPYAAVDQLADLVRCGMCADYGMDHCPEHAGLIVLEVGPAAGSTGVTWIDGTTAASTDPEDAISQLGELSLQGVRRPLPARERARRRVASKRSRVSRRRNR